MSQLSRGLVLLSFLGRTRITGVTWKMTQSTENSFWRGQSSHFDMVLGSLLKPTGWKPCFSPVRFEVLSACGNPLRPPRPQLYGRGLPRRYRQLPVVSPDPKVSKCPKRVDSNTCLKLLSIRPDPAVYALMVSSVSMLIIQLHLF